MPRGERYQVLLAGGTKVGNYSKDLGLAAATAAHHFLETGSAFVRATNGDGVEIRSTLDGIKPGPADYELIPYNHWGPVGKKCEELGGWRRAFASTFTRLMNPGGAR